MSAVENTSFDADIESNINVALAAKSAADLVKIENYQVSEQAAKHNASITTCSKFCQPSLVRQRALNVQEKGASRQIVAQVFANKSLIYDSSKSLVFYSIHSEYRERGFCKSGRHGEEQCDLNAKGYCQFVY